MQMNRHAYDIVETTHQQIYNLQKLLCPKFFPDASYRSFRAMMKKTGKPLYMAALRLMFIGLVISGSVALQFFIEHSFPDCDLDLYVYSQSANLIASWLESRHYRLSVGQTFADFDDMFNASKTNPTPYDRLEGVFSVFTFLHPLSREKVQLIIVKNSIMHVVLRFHSSEWV